MKSNVFIIHGIYGSPEENWFPWLKEKLAKILNSKLILVKNAGHFNTKVGYTKFELLFNDIKILITKDL